MVRGEGAELATITTWYENPHPVDPVKRARPARRETRSAPPEPDVPELTEELRPAAGLLAGLRQREPRLLLSENDVRRLAAGTRRWLERGLTPETVARTLCAGLPTGTIRWPTRLLAHRLREWLPPELPPTPPAPKLLPLQNRERCDRAFRGAGEGLCGGCRSRGPRAGHGTEWPST
ncbi:hypothetical protein GPZ77_13560 [Streptomyces sp. QHH-9511]|uniref:hypothetical protein n=1 Tax=Streptomyces sp. QHH-9511 TaxID=2684468 RepID=UPI001315E300|nr:hypothetical protein [Streptomyces sp. QHH-9511]QGZ49264.1 hypothetical protein GPZ77_13560 [Streptomyces sp. QHH-9511]